MESLMTVDNFYRVFWTLLVGFTVTVAVVAMILHVPMSYQMPVPVGETEANKFIREQLMPHLDEWATEVKPAPDNPHYDPNRTLPPMPQIYTWPPNPIIDAWHMVNPVGTAHAARHPETPAPQENTYLYPTPLKIWTVEQQATEREHISCTASRTLVNGARLTVRAYKNKTIVLILDDVNFDLDPERPYRDAVVSIDGNPVAVTIAKRNTKWQTTFDISDIELSKLANAKILRLTVGAYYIEMDMTGSANAAKYVSMCNASGQDAVHRRIVEAAVPAEIRVP
jgi:hypothetical protein